MSGQLFVDELRTWIGTPWAHSQALKGVGVDCGQLAITAAANIGHGIGVAKAYSIASRDAFPLTFCRNSENLIEVSDATVGSILVINIDGYPRHIAIKTNDSSVIHSALGHGVKEEPILDGYLSDTVGIFNIKSLCNKDCALI